MHDIHVAQMKLLLDGRGVLYEQIARAIKQRICGDEFRQGMKLPSSRALASILKVSRRSVVEAYELLATEELIRPVVGVGTVVNGALNHHAVSTTHDLSQPATSRFAQRARALPKHSLIGTTQGLRYMFQYGAPVVNPSVLLSWSRKLTAAARRTAPNYGTALGHPALRAVIANYLQRHRGLNCSAEDVLICSGTQQAISLVARVLLNEGDAAIVEDPFYELAVHALIAHGAAVEYVRTDAEGLCVGEIPNIAARMALVTPAHQFPSGVEMSTQRCLELLSWAQANRAWIVEDNYDSEFQAGRSSHRSLYSMDLHDQVIYIGSFSKSLFPSLRLGYIICPKELKTDLVNAKRLDDLGSPVSEQAALAMFMQSGLYEKQLRASIKETMARRKALIQALRHHFKDSVIIGPHNSGMHLVLWFPDFDRENLNALIQAAASRDVGVQSIDPCYRTLPQHRGLLLGYASLPAADIRVAIGRLAQCVDSITGHSARRTELVLDSYAPVTSNRASAECL